MIGRLTFDKSSQDVDLLLYSVYLINEYGHNGVIRRNFDRNSFVERMADYMHEDAYNAEGNEVRTIFNKSLYAQYYGFIDRIQDSEGKECLRITNRGKRLLPFISLESTDDGFECVIREDKLRYVQDLVWESVLFDPHGKHNNGAQTSKTDVDPLGVIFTTIMTLGYASNDEIFYVLFSLNRGDKGTLHINKSYSELIDDIRHNRDVGDLDYSELFEDWNVTNKVDDAKVINIFTDPNFRILVKRTGDDGIEYNYIDDSCHRFFSFFRLVDSVSQPKQLLLYSDSPNSCRSWIKETLLGRFGDTRNVLEVVEKDSSIEEIEASFREVVTRAQSNPFNDYYWCIVAETESALKDILSTFNPAFERINDLPSRQHGYSCAVLEPAGSNHLLLPPNFNIIPIIKTKSPIMTEPIFDGTFKRLKIDEREETITVPSDNPFDEKLFKEYLSLLLNNGNLILTGAPGTGKTFLAKAMAASIVGGCAWDDLSAEQKKRCGFVQFHPSYDYTDFVEGLRPDSDGKFKRRDGVFKEFCKMALDVDGKECVFIIDEINRGELSKIFGELFYAIEPDYRGTEGIVMTQYNEMVEKEDDFKGGFYIPDNVFIIGTMNDVDRGVEAMDFAVRRRFVWREITADESAKNMGITGDAYAKMVAVNNMLSQKGLSDAYHIGGAYFRKLKDGDFNELWNLRLKGVISEYFRGEPDAKDKIQAVENAYFMARDNSQQENS